MRFNHLFSDQYSQFLWFLSNSLWRISENKPLCDKLVCLNKALNGILASYRCGLPDVFMFSHPVGTVLGNAGYSDYLVVVQNVTVNTGAVFLGKAVALSAGAKIIGNVTVGDYASIGVNTTVYNRDVPANHVIYKDDSGKTALKKNKGKCAAMKIFVGEELAPIDKR